MVRRLKEDIREIQGGFPMRRIERLVIDDLPEHAPELELSRLLDEYRRAREERFATTSNRTQAAAGLLVVGLQQRLLSSIEAFARSLQVHRRTVERQWGQAEAQAESAAAEVAAQADLFVRAADADDERAEWTGEDLEADEAAEIERVTQATEAAASRDSATADQWVRERALLDQMEQIAETSRHAPDGKDECLIAWIREHMCPDLPEFGRRSAGSRRSGTTAAC